MISDPLVTTDSARAAIEAYLGARADTRDRLVSWLGEEPESVLGHCLDGYLHMVSSRPEGFAAARQAASRARGASRRTPGSADVRHVDALEAWSEGDLRRASTAWDALLTDHPRDVIAIRISQFVLSYLGETRRMADTIARVLPHWNETVPGYGYVLGCEAYALEENGDYARAEDTGRRAVALNHEDIWAAHAVAHVCEMEGRLREGVDWIGALAGQWARSGNFARHLRWHEALYELELGRVDRVLELYDREIWPGESHEYLDLTNAASLLWRLEQAEIDVGPRWRELAGSVRAHLDDHALVFADVHYVMALAGADDPAALAHLLASSARFAATDAGTEAGVMARVGLPLARAIVAHRRRAYGDAVDLLLPIRRDIRLIGGSHAQRDVFEQLLIDAAWKAPRHDVAAALLEERTDNRPGNRWGWAHRARVLEAVGSVGPAADAQRRLDRLRRQGDADE